MPMKTLFNGFRTGLCAGALALGTGLAAPVGAADFNIKVSFLAGPEDEDYDGALVFKDFVEAASNGRVAVEVFHSGSFCGNEAECLDNLQSGILEVFITTLGGFGNVWGPGQVIDLPYMFRDDRVAECVFDGPFTDQVRTAVLEQGIPMRLMVISNTGGWRNIATTTRQVRTPEDFRGLRIRTIAAEIAQEFVRQMGGNPTPIAWPEVYTSLATGVVEGTMNGITDIMNMRFTEAGLRYLTLDGHSYMGAMWWFSEPVWQTLPEDIRRIVVDGMYHLKRTTRVMPIRRQIEAYDAFRAAGGTVYVPTPEEKAQFQQAAAGMRDWYAQRFGTAWLEKLDAAIADCEAAVDAHFAAVNQ